MERKQKTKVPDKFKATAPNTTFVGGGQTVDAAIKAFDNNVNQALHGPEKVVEHAREIANTVEVTEISSGKKIYLEKLEN